MKVKTTRDIHMTMAPKTKAIATETNIAMMTFSACSVFIRSEKPNCSSPAILIQATINVPPSNSNTSDTVVEVGIPSVLKTSRIMTSVTITARKMVITSLKEYWLGVIMPCRATSIIPDDITAPNPTPIEAMMTIVR